MPVSQQAGHSRVVIATGLGLALFLVLLTAAGYSRQMITGEGLYDLSYPARYPFWESITTFFSGRVAARFMHGVILTVLYKMFGFNPPAFYLVLQLGLVVSAVAISLSLVNEFKDRWQAAFLVLVLSSLPFLVPQLLFFKKAHHVFAWAFFWIAVLLFNRWSRSRGKVLLAGAALFFVVAFLSYEAIAFLLPVAVFISHSNFKERRDLIGAALVAVGITLAAYTSSQFLAFAADVHGRQIQGGLFQVLVAPLAAPWLVLQSIFSNGLAEPFAYATWMVQAGKLLVFGLLLAGGWLLARELRVGPTWSRLQNTPTFWLALAGIWLIFYTYLPFLLAGQRPNEDNLVGFGYGLVFLLLAAANAVSHLRARALILVIPGLFFMFSGLFGYSQSIKTELQVDSRFVNFVSSLRQQVPNVQEGTTFILVNTNWGRTACIGYMNMLYSRERLHCIHLLDNDSDESYARLPGELVEDTGRVFEDGFVILAARADGQAVVLPALAEADAPNVPLVWEDTNPILTDFSRISSEQRPSLFYDYILRLSQRK